MMNRPLLYTLAALACAASSFAQSSTGTASLSAAKSPQDPVPGLIARIYFGPKNAVATNLIAVMESGKEFKESIKPQAVDILREDYKNPDTIEYHAFGYMILDKDTEVSFDVGNNNCVIGGKNLGGGKFTHKFAPGKRTVMIERKDGGQGQGGFAATDSATGQSVLSYTGEMLSTELSKSFRVGNATLKTVQLSPTPAKP